MIISNRFVRTYLFGSRVAAIRNKSFECCVSTAKEGWFQRRSTIILEPTIGNTVGVGAARLRPCGKIIYSPTLRKSDCLQLHDILAKTLDGAGEEGRTLQEALEQIFADWKRRGIPLETANLVADQGQADAQLNLGGMCEFGLGIRKAAERGDAAAQCLLGDLYHHGLGVHRNYAEAYYWYRKAAEQGDHRAQYNLGLLYDKGQGMPQDDIEAAASVRKAAEQGDAGAQYNLGLLYQMGRGVPQDDAQAIAWYRKAAEQGNAAAQCGLGLMYDSGYGVPQDFAQAAVWLRKAAEQGNAVAQYKLAHSYYREWTERMERATST